MQWINLPSYSVQECVRDRFCKLHLQIRIEEIISLIASYLF